jgi:hypothetical protein
LAAAWVTKIRGSQLWTRAFNLKLAAGSDAYWDEFRETLADAGI